MADYLQDLVQNIYTNCDMKGFDDYNKAIDNITKNSSKSARERIRLLEAEQKSRIRLKDYEDKYARKKEQQDLNEISRMQKRNGLIRYGMRLLGTYFSIRTLQSIIQTGSHLQLLQRSIEGLTGSGQDWQFINEQAYRFGVSLDTVAKGYKNFFSSANMAGFSSKDIQGMFSDVLLGARAIGASTQQIEGALLALEQMMSKGRVSMEELRRQLGNALPGAFEIGAKAMGVTTMQFNEMVKAGISAQEFVPKFIKTFKDQYAKGWVDVEQTVAVAQGRLLVAWQQFTMEFLHGETGKALARGINQLAEVMRSPEFINFVKVLGQIFTLVMRIISFVLQNMKLVLMILGTSGLLGVLMRHRLLWRILNMEIGRGSHLLLLFGKRGIMAFGSLTKASKAFMGQLLKILLPLLIIEDVFMWLSNKFLGTNFGTITGDAIGAIQDSIKNKPDLTTNTAGALDQALMSNPKFKKQFQRYQKTGSQEDLNKLRQLMPTSIETNAGSFYIPQNPNLGVATGGAAGVAGTLPNLELQKEDNISNNVTIGDIYISSNSANPMQVAQEVQNQLVALFMGQGLQLNVEGVVT